MNWSTAFYDTYRNIVSVIKQCNIKIWLLLIGILFIGFIGYLFDKANTMYRKTFSIVCYSAFLTFIYTLLLFTRIGQDKIARSENIFTLLVYFLVMFTLAICWIVSKANISITVLEFAGVILLIYAIGGQYEQSMSCYHGNKNLAYMVNSSIVEQFREADNKNMDSFELHIPQGGLGDYWFSGDRIALTLYKHRIVNTLHHPVLVLEDYGYFINTMQ